MPTPLWPLPDRGLDSEGKCVTHPPNCSRKHTHNFQPPCQTHPLPARGLDFEGMCSTLAKAPPGSAVLLHACAHNPTGARTYAWLRLPPLPPVLFGMQAL